MFYYTSFLLVYLSTYRSKKISLSDQTQKYEILFFVAMQEIKHFLPRILSHLVKKKSISKIRLEIFFRCISGLNSIPDQVPINATIITQ